MKVVTGNFGKSAPSDLSRILRELADSVDAGNITSMVCAFVEDDRYSFNYSASLVECLTLSTLLQHSCIQRFKE